MVSSMKESMNFSMISYSSIHPQFFASIAEIQQFISVFGADKGRFVLDIPGKEWLSLVSEHGEDFVFENLTPKQKKMFHILNEKLRNNNFVIPMNIEAENWKEASSIAKTYMDLSYEVGDCFGEESADEWSDVYWDIINKPLQNTFLSTGHHNDLIALLKPFCIISRQVWLIDPYFDFGSQSATFLLKSINEYAKSGKVKEVIIVTKLLSNISAFQTLIDSLGQINIKIRWLSLSDEYLRKNKNRFDFHDRYFFTDKNILLQLGKGFTVKATKKPSFSISIHSHEQHKLLLESFVRPLIKELSDQKYSRNQLIKEQTT